MTGNVLRQPKIAIIGLGYVGLPLALAFSKHFDVVGFDINGVRIQDLRNGIDKTGEVTDADTKYLAEISFTSEISDIKGCDVYIVTVPTPINNLHEPDLSPLIHASMTVGSVLSQGNLVIYESTVFPGATEEVCVPILEEKSGLELNTDFFVGYSPERINPGDPENKLTNIVKVTSGSSKEAALIVDELYKNIIDAGTHLASSIRVAEAAKVIENTQRDVNIALVNEFSRIFNSLKIDTKEVLDAASTKWNFIKMKPGFVGGHCISVDPYYLIHKAQKNGYYPDIINTSRMLNESMPSLVCTDYVNAISQTRVLKGSTCLVVGITFKANCPDLRNSKVPNLINGLRDHGVNVDIYDPCADPMEVKSELNMTSLANIDESIKYDGLILCVEHEHIFEQGQQYWEDRCKPNATIFDLKAIFPKSFSTYRM